MNEVKCMRRVENITSVHQRARNQCTETFDNGSPLSAHVLATCFREILTDWEWLRIQKKRTGPMNESLQEVEAQVMQDVRGRLPAQCYMSVALPVVIGLPQRLGASGDSFGIFVLCIVVVFNVVLDIGIACSVTNIC